MKLNEAGLRAGGRRSIRRAGFDYASSSAFFITICTHDRACLFGEVVDGRVSPNDLGRIANSCWSTIPDHFPHVTLDAWIVMPNHVHGILVIVGATHASPLPRHRSRRGSLGAIVGSFKSATSKRINLARGITGKVWQRNYYERIVRDEPGMNEMRRYIANNPIEWPDDPENMHRRHDACQEFL